MSMTRISFSAFWNCRGWGSAPQRVADFGGGTQLGRGGGRVVRWSASGRTQGAGEVGNLPQAEVAVPRRLGRDDARAQQHWPDRVHPHRGRVQDQHMLNTSVGHDQLTDRHAQTRDEEQDVLVHLRVAGSTSGGLEDEAAGWEVDVCPRG